MAYSVQKVYSARKDLVYHVDKLHVCANDLKLSQVNCWKAHVFILMISVNIQL